MAELKDGIIVDKAVTAKIFPKNEKGAMDAKKVKGIVIHQTNNQSAASTFNAYTAGRWNPKKKITEYFGAHFLIDRGSGTYRENKKDKSYPGIDGKIYQTAHVSQTCNHAGNLKSKLYPSNSHSIGIEIVGFFDEKDGYPTSSVAQVNSAAWLVGTLIELLSSIASTDAKNDHLYAHGNISRGKEPSEGISSLEQIRKKLEEEKAAKEKAAKAKEITVFSSIPFRMPPMAIDNTRVVIRYMPLHFSDGE